MPAWKMLAYALALAGFTLQASCVTLLWRRKLQRENYFFLSFLIFQMLSTAVLSVLYFAKVGNSTTYFYAYWVQSAVSDIFAFAVLNELFCAAFKPFAGLRDMAQVVFRWAALAVVLVGLVVFFSSSLPNPQRISLLVVNLERSISVMQCGLLLFLFMGSSYLGLSKRSRVFGISLGFGLTAVVNLALYSLLAIIGYSKSRFVSFLPGAISVLVLCIWNIYIASPEPARETVNVPVTSPLLRWNEVAMALGHSGGRVAFVDNPEPFMPNVERMVEEVMKRDMAGAVRR